MNPPGPNRRADWYLDPRGRHEFRYFNGEEWTADVSSGGTRFVDPLGLAESPRMLGGGAAPSPSPSRRDRTATAAMVLGIVGVSIAWMPFLVVPGAICAFLGLAFGVVAFRRRRPEARGFAIAGMATGGAGLLLVAIGVWTTRVVVDAIDEYEKPPPRVVEIGRCALADGMLRVEGTIENVGDRTSDFRIVIRVPGETALRDREAVIEVDDLAAGETRPFRTTYRSSSADSDDRLAEPTCPVVAVTGPLPLGIDID